MKRILRKSRGIILLLFFVTAGGTLYSQTSGTFSFSVTTTSNGGYSPGHLLAIWIENNSTAFVKTKIRYSSNSNLNHLATWDAKSGRNIVDAVTGPTLTSHGTITFLWNGTNVAGTVVPDGSYFVWLEMAWGDNLTSDKTVNSYSFTKGPNTFHSTPANTDNFRSLSLDWTPLSTAIEGILESKDINVYPNPTSGLLKIDFKHPEKECLIRILNEAGQIIYIEKISDIQTGTRTLDLTRFTGGNYYCTLHFPEKDIVFNILLVK